MSFTFPIPSSGKINGMREVVKEWKGKERCVRPGTVDISPPPSLVPVATASLCLQPQK